MEIGILAQRFRLPWQDSVALASLTGVSGVQLYVRTPFEELLKWDSYERREAVKYCEKFHMKIFSLCAEVGGFGFREREKNPHNIDWIKRSIDLALDLGCNIVTSHIGVIQTSANSPFRQAQLDALREIGQYAASRNCYMAIETGPEKGKIMRDFLLELDTPGIGINLDPGNMAMVTGEAPQETVKALAPWIVHTHIKDGKHFLDCDPEDIYRAFATGGIQQLIAETGKIFVETPVGEGDVDYPKYIQSLKDINYDGALVIERERTDHSFEEVCECVYFLKQLL